jgi:hypothetical protein
MPLWQKYAPGGKCTAGQHYSLQVASRNTYHAVRKILLFAVLLSGVAACSPSQNAAQQQSSPPAGGNEARAARTVHTFDLRRLARQRASAEWKRVRATVAGATGADSALVFAPPADSTVLTLGGAEEQDVPWSEATHLVLDVAHENARRPGGSSSSAARSERLPHSSIVHLDFFQKRPRRSEHAGADAPRFETKIGAMPKLRTQMIFPFERLDGQHVFPPRYPRQMKGLIIGRRMNTDEIEKVEMSLAPQGRGYDSKVRIRSIRLTEGLPAPLPNLEDPIVDSLGQWTAKDWPGKTEGTREMKRRLRALEDPAAGSSFPENWSRFGGWKEKRFEATGFFRTHHDGQRWWLVDPEGYAFLSVGVDGVRPGGAEGPVEGMTDLFEWVPDGDSTFADAVERKRGKKSVSYSTANLIRAFGPDDWRARWEKMSAGLLKKWRFNTLANWSSSSLIQSAKLPYVLDMDGFPRTEKTLYRDFPDVFDPAYERAAQDYAQQLESYKDDPYLIGYFLRNEPKWAWGAPNIALEMLATPEPSHTRRRLADWLEKQYDGDRTRFEREWDLAAFAAVETTAVREAPSPAADSLLWTFSGKMVDEYIQPVCEAVEEVDPNHLNLGMRYARISSDLLYRAGQCFDVFSINGYSSLGPPPTGEIAERTGRPVLIGEFHFGALDRGLPATGIAGGAASQQARGAGYRYYVEQGFARPELVGIHYYLWSDQLVTGRFDGENYNIGLVDVAHRPYRALIDAAHRTHERMYRVGAGRRAPFDDTLDAIPAVDY